MEPLNDANEPNESCARSCTERIYIRSLRFFKRKYMSISVLEI